MTHILVFLGWIDGSHDLRMMMMSPPRLPLTPSLLQVVTRCFQLMTSLFQAPPTVAVPYLRALGPGLLRFLQQAERTRPQSPEDLDGVLEGVRALEALVQAAEESHRRFNHTQVG